MENVELISGNFFALPADSDLIAELNKALPSTPFTVLGYFQSRQRIGNEAWILGLRDENGALICGCGAFLRKGFLNRGLTIVSVPNVAANSQFWIGVLEFCAQAGVTQLQLSTYGSPEGTEIPDLACEFAKRKRCEFALDLSIDLDASLNAKHRREVRKALQSGVSFIRPSSGEAIGYHLAVMCKSMERRRNRGENVEDLSLLREHEAIIESKSGELFQAVQAGIVLSSALVLRSKEEAYLFTTGTTPAGMLIGASHFLIFHIAQLLKKEGSRKFVLGGAEEGSGLARFKSRFGAYYVHLQEGQYYVGSAWRRKVSKAISMLRENPRAVIRNTICNVIKWEIYSVEVDQSNWPVQDSKLEFRPLAAEDIKGISVGDPAFRFRQLDRLARFGGSYAYGVFIDGCLAHISWLLSPAEIKQDVPQWFAPLEKEYEITCCETLADFRRRGAYTFAVRNLLEVARKHGACRVFMKTAPDNKASQLGIRKAGLSGVGFVLLISFPIIRAQITWRQFSRGLVSNIRHQ